MTSEQFAYWLQGFAELSPNTPPTAEQWKMIQEHLSLVFNKVTPPLAPHPRYLPTRWPYTIPNSDFEPKITCMVTSDPDYATKTVC